MHLPLLGTKPESMKAEEWVLLNRQVLGVIRLILSRSVAHNVVKNKTTVDLMKALIGMYEKSFANNKVHLMKKLFNLKMAENASVARHLNEFNTITNQLSSVEIDFDDEICALIILASLSNSWEAMKMTMSNFTGKEKLKYNDKLNERARSMMLHVGLPKTFWADAISTAAYLINRGPSVPMEFRLLEKVWSGKEVKFSHLKVFCCVSYFHIDSDACSKLDVKSKICFFIGYGDEKFGYRFWDEQNRKIIRSRNVIFNKQVMYKDRSTVVSYVTEINQKKYEFVNLDELTESTIQKGVKKIRRM